MELILQRINEIVKEYNELPIPTALKVSELHRELTSQLFYLVSHRAHFHTLHNKHILESEKSVAKATAEANEKHQELYLIRQVMKYADGVVNAMRSEISTLNKEK